MQDALNFETPDLTRLRLKLKNAPEHQEQYFKRTELPSQRAAAHGTELSSTLLRFNCAETVHSVPVARRGAQVRDRVAELEAKLKEVKKAELEVQADLEKREKALKDAEKMVRGMR